MSEEQPGRIVGVVGLVFFGIAVVKFFSGDGWLVWLILGLLFGGASGVKSLLERRGES